MAHLVNAGHDPRTIAEELVKHLRNGFLALMAPDLVQLPSNEVDALAAQSQRLGAPALVAAIEKLGQILVELRHAPDPRVLVEVALVQLTRPAADVGAGPSAGAGDDTGGLAARVAKLEQALASGAFSPAAAAPVDPTTGRARLGGRAQRAATAEPAAARRPGTRRRRAAAPAAPAPAEPAPLPRRESRGPAATGRPASGGGRPTVPQPLQHRPRRHRTRRAIPKPSGPTRCVSGCAVWPAPCSPRSNWSAPTTRAVAPRSRSARPTRCTRRSASSTSPRSNGRGRRPRAAPSRSHGAGGPAAEPGDARPAPPTDAPRPEPVVEPESDQYDDYAEPDETRAPIGGRESVLDRVAEAFPGAALVDPPAGS